MKPNRKAMRKITLKAGLLFFLLSLSANSELYRAELEVKVDLAGKTQNQALEEAVSRAKEEAVKAYLASRIPPGILAEKREAVDAILKRAEAWVSSWELLETGEAQGALEVKIAVDLDQNQLEPSLRGLGLVPSGPLPRAFVIAEETLQGKQVPSGWEKEQEARGAWNDCEAGLAYALEKWGVPVIEPEPGMPPANPEIIMNAKGREAKELIYADLSDNYRAQVLVVARSRSSDEENRVSVDLAVARFKPRGILFSDRITWSPTDEKKAASGTAIQTACELAGTKAAEVLLKTALPEMEAGEERELALVVKGLPSFRAMKELEQAIEKEAPAANQAELVKMKPGEVEFKLHTNLSPLQLVDWLESKRFNGFRLKLESAEESRLWVSVVPGS